MAFITTPTAGGTYCNGGQDRKIGYSSNLQYGNGSNQIARLEYYVNAVLVATHDFTANSPAGDDPTLPLPLMPSLPNGSGNSTTTLNVKAYEWNGVGYDPMTFQDSTISLNAVDCNTIDPATQITQTGAHLTGHHVIIAAGNWFGYSTTPGGPYTYVPQDSYAAGASQVNLTGLTPATTYYAVVETRSSETLGGPADQVVSLSDEIQFTTLAVPVPTCNPASNVTAVGATANGSVTADLPAGGSMRFRYGTTAGGPYTSSAGATPYAVGAVSAALSGLSLTTTYYYVLEVLDSGGAVVATSGECTFTTIALAAGEPCPLPDDISKCPAVRTYSVGGTEYTLIKSCDANGEFIAVYQLCAGKLSGPPTNYTLAGLPYTPQGTVADCNSGFDFEQFVFCDTGTSPATPFISRVRFDENGDLVPDASGTFALDAITPYTPVGAVTVCGSGTLPPQSFCFKDSVTTPTDFPGRRFTATLSIARGFAVKSVIVGSTTYALGITWGVNDEDATAFMPALQAGIQAKIPGSTVTVVGATVIDGCDVNRQNFTINIACIKADKAPVNVDIVYDAGADLIQNAGFEESPFNDAFHQAMRQDNGGNIRCTTVANRGWETNDPLQQFEHWPAGFLGATPTPRGTGIQEVNANGANTIWQTIVVPTPATYTLRATVGGRDVTEQFPIKLSTGDTNDTGPGDLINATITAPSVTGGTGNPWTAYTQTIFLASGTYTLSLKGPGTSSIGGLFTDLRLFTSVPDTIQTMTPDDTCIITEDVTTKTNKCESWQPLTGAGGAIIQWTNPQTGVTLSNAAFWAQTPAPECCTVDPADAGDAVLGNLISFFPVCGTVDGERVPMIRQVILDQSGGAISSEFIGLDGAGTAPSTWTPGDCGDIRLDVLPVCFTVIAGPPGVHQAYKVISVTGNVTVPRYYYESDTGAIHQPADVTEVECVKEYDPTLLCDDNGSFLRHTIYGSYGNITGFRDTDLAHAPYVPVGTVQRCSDVSGFTETLICVNGVTQVRRTAADGTFTFYGNNGAVTAPPVYTIGDCFPNQRQAIPVCFELLAAPGTVISGWQIASTGQTNYTQFYYYDPLTNTQYTPAQVTVVSCVDCCPIVIGEGCWVNGLNSGEYTSLRLANGSVLLVDKTTGATVAPGDVTACTATTTNVDNTIQRQTGVGAIVIPAGAQSITVTVAAGNPTVTVNGDPAVTLLPGMVMTWGVVASGQQLLNAHTFTGVVGSDFYVTTTRI